MNTFNSKVRDLSHKGLGVIDHPDGRVFFVRGVWPGDEGLFSIADDAQKYQEAQLISLSQESRERVEIPCPHRGVEKGKCGGCPWMMASYPSQLEYKVKRLRHALEKRKVSLAQTQFSPIIPSPRILEYRNRVQLKTTGNQLGYVSEGSSVFAPVSDCLILNPKLRALFHELKSTLPRHDFTPTENHTWCFVDLDDELKLEEVVSNKRRPFKQGNTEQNEFMREWVKRKFSELPSHQPVIDLFCGSGNFTEVLSQLGMENILAVEVQGSALEVLKQKQLPGVRVMGFDLTQKGAWAQVAKLQPHAKAILLDPPREGLDKRRNFLKYFDNLETLFYISCELDTFARDAFDLTRSGFDLIELSPLDLFPHTPHVEILSVFKKRSH